MRIVGWAARLFLSPSSVQRTRYGSYPLSSSRLVPSSVARPGKSDLRHTYTLMGWPCSLLSLMDFQFQVRRWPLSGHVHASRSGVRAGETKPYPVPNSANRPIPCFRKQKIPEYMIRFDLVIGWVAVSYEVCKWPAKERRSISKQPGYKLQPRSPLSWSWTALAAARVRRGRWTTDERGRAISAMSFGLGSAFHSGRTACELGTFPLLTKPRCNGMSASALRRHKTDMRPPCTLLRNAVPFGSS